jgi:hypothetical protein
VALAHLKQHGDNVDREGSPSYPGIRRGMSAQHARIRGACRALGQ